MHFLNNIGRSSLRAENGGYRRCAWNQRSKFAHPFRNKSCKLMIWLRWSFESFESRRHERLRSLEQTSEHATSWKQSSSLRTWCSMISVCMLSKESDEVSWIECGKFIFSKRKKITVICKKIISEHCKVFWGKNHPPLLAERGRRRIRELRHNVIAPHRCSALRGRSVWCPKASL